MASEEVNEPGEALVQRRVERGTGDPAERRITVDGDVLERTSSTAKFENGSWSFGTQPLVWRRIGRLEPDELERVRAAIADSGFMELDAVHRPTETSIGGSNVTWTANLDGRTHEVVLLGVPDVQVDAVDAVQAATESAIAAAIKRR